MLSNCIPVAKQDHLLNLLILNLNNIEYNLKPFRKREEEKKVKEKQI